MVCKIFYLLNATRHETLHAHACVT